MKKNAATLKTRNPMAGALAHPEHQPKVVPARKRLRRPLPEDYEYAY